MTYLLKQKYSHLIVTLGISPHDLPGPVKVHLFTGWKESSRGVLIQEFGRELLDVEALLELLPPILRNTHLGVRHVAE